MELNEALSRISEIRQHMAHTSTFRGYRAATTAFSGGIGLLAVCLQNWLLPHPMQQIGGYLTLWISAAFLNVLAFTIELAIRYRRSSSPLERETTLLAADLFAPSLITGATLTAVLVGFAAPSVWLLPGLWSILFGLGIFASRRLLPSPLFYTGAYYLLTGLAVLALAQGENALHPWAMGVTFGLGQLLNAGLLYWTLERNHGQV